MLATVGEVYIVITVDAFVPVVGRIPIPSRRGADGMTGLFSIGMHLGKMLVPISMFYANPFTAITAGIVGKILTTNQAEITIIANSCTL